MENLWDTYRSWVTTNGDISWPAIVISVVASSLIIKTIFSSLANRFDKLSHKTKGHWDNIIADGLLRVRFWSIFYMTAHFIVSLAGKLKGRSQEMATDLLVILVMLQLWLVGDRMIKSWRTWRLDHPEEGQSSRAGVGLLAAILRGALAVLILLMALSNLGVDIGALVAGLGVGGVAVALAAQNILGDLLASLSIIMDRPFEVGDFIVVGTEQGTVEYIGLKTTRLRSLSGEELIFSNKDLLESRVHNFKRMRERRIVQSFGILYSTPSELLDKIPMWVKEIMDQMPKLRYDRCHFANYGASSLDYELVFWVLGPEYVLYMSEQQKLLISIFEKFQKEGVEFAFPTRTIYNITQPQQD